MPMSEKPANFYVENHGDRVMLCVEPFGAALLPPAGALRIAALLTESVIKLEAAEGGETIDPTPDRP
jgi:hypothetical protein